MKKLFSTLTLIILTIIGIQLNAQQIEFNSYNWKYTDETAQIINYEGKPALEIIKKFTSVRLDDFVFENGIIEFDIKPTDQHFNHIQFRYVNDKEAETFYIRNHFSGNNMAPNAIQYAPIIDGVNLWDMLPQYQSNASFTINEWNHIKLVVNGKQMKVYINNPEKPDLEIPCLLGNQTSGTIAFMGTGIIANLNIYKNKTEDLIPVIGFDYTANDPKYIDQWMVSEPLDMEKDIDLDHKLLSNEETQWAKITTEFNGLLNLTREFGKTKGKRIVWLKTTINSDKTQEKLLQLGFSDEVWVLINGKPLYVDKNLYNTPMAKVPDGRCSLENTTFSVPFQEGENELMIGVVNHFYGWGIIARLQNIDGLSFDK